MNTIECHYPADHALHLSAHEVSALMLLREAPVDANSTTLDVVALHEAGLARLVEPAQAAARFAISDEGLSVLRALGAG